jgi:hypothetical protein
MDDSGKRESEGEEEKAPKKKAEDNPWYLLATLYGVPERGDDEVQAKNRAAWNRYFAANLEEKTRTKLIEEKRHSAEELTPFSPEQLGDVKRTFSKRCEASGKILRYIRGELPLPASDADIDFCYVDFEQDAFFGGYLLAQTPFFRARLSPARLYLPGRRSPREPTLAARPSPAGPPLAARPSPAGPPLAARPSPARPPLTARPSPAAGPPLTARPSPREPSLTARPSPA